MQGFFPGFFYALLADDVAAPIIAGAPLFFEQLKISLGNTTYITQYMCRCLTLRIFTHPAGTQLDTREFISVRSKPGSFSVVEIVTQQDRGIAPALIQALDKTLAEIGGASCRDSVCQYV